MRDQQTPLAAAGSPSASALFAILAPGSSGRWCALGQAKPSLVRLSHLASSGQGAAFWANQDPLRPLRALLRASARGCAESEEVDWARLRCGFDFWAPPGGPGSSRLCWAMLPAPHVPRREGAWSQASVEQVAAAALSQRGAQGAFALVEESCLAGDFPQRAAAAQLWGGWQARSQAWALGEWLEEGRSGGARGRL